MGFCFPFRCKGNVSNFSNDLEDEIIENKELGLKIYICGNLPEKKEFINIFTEKISDTRYINRGDYEFKTNQIYWIAKIIPVLSKESISKIANEIREDFDNKEGKKIEQNVILCFGDDNIDELIKGINEIGSAYSALFIIISEKQIKVNYDQRKITNIILNDETKKRLNNIIISQLWEYDCYYNERGNQLCRYTPDNIFKNLYNNVPFYSINILLTGKSRAGKSTFINYLTNKLTALESCKKETVSKKKTQYCFYPNTIKFNENDNYENVPIKFFDTPGIVPGKIEDSKNFLIELLDNKTNNLEEQIHFVLFFNNEGDSLEGTNEILQILNDCKKPVLIIINRAKDDSDDGRTSDIKSTISFFTRNNFMNLIDDKNFVQVNIVGTKRAPDYGVNDIFKRIYEIFNEKNDFSNKNKFKKSIDNDINELLKQYNNLIEKPLEKQEREKDRLDTERKIQKLKEKIDDVSEMFKQININNVIITGRKSINKCRNLIISLGDLSNTLNSIDDDIPAISFFQAYMVKEIGEILGFNWKEMDKQVKIYLEEMKDNLDNMDVSKYYDKNKHKKDISIINKDDIIKELEEENKKSEDNFIKQLAKQFNTIRQNEINNDLLLKNKIDKMMTDGICIECRDYLIKVLEDSKGIFFWKNYLNACKKLNKNLELLKSKEKDWCEKEMKIINK